jgi:hypothetical protein
VEEAHTIPAVVAARRFEFNLIRVTDTAPGAFPVVAFSVTDPTQSNAAYDILNDPEFTAGGGVSRLAVLLGWETSDYTNTGSGSVPATPISINALTSAVANADGTFSVTSPVPLPATVTGSGIAAIEGHPAVDPDGDGTFDVRVPVRAKEASDCRPFGHAVSSRSLARERRGRRRAPRSLATLAAESELLGEAPPPLRMPM